MRFRELYFESRLNSLFLILGKVVRFAFFLIFLIALLGKTQTLAGFDLNQILLFYMTFNLIDITSQFFLRGTYAVRSLIDRGQVDLFLTQPVNALFRIASDIVDLLDFLTLIPVLVLLGIVIIKLGALITLGNFLLYLLLCLNALLIAATIHILVISLSLLTQEVSSGIWIYRDLMTMGRFPVDIYSRSLQLVLTFLIPIAVMVSFPAKALIGMLSAGWVITSFAIGAVFFAASLRFWHHALKNYTSISS